MMKSIRTKITLLIACVMIVSLTAATLISVSAIRDVGVTSSEQMLYLLCESGQKNLNSYYDSVAQSVEIVSSFIDSDMDGMDGARLAAHVDRTRDIFLTAAEETHGVLTFYYRIDPNISRDVKGFWYTNLDGKGFTEHEVTDITAYNTWDTTRLVWFTVPKATGKPVWLPPYITDNLDWRVISYNKPVYYNGNFIGVIGIEIDYSTMAEQVNHITLCQNGYAFLNDEAGKILYHPRIDVTQLSEEELPTVPDGLLSHNQLVHYTFDGVEKEGVCLPLSNGMRLNVAVPVSEINGGWQTMIARTALVSALLLLLSLLLTLRLTRRITKPLQDLTDAAKEVNDGNYDIELDYKGNDEVGTLTQAFNQLIRHLKVYISNLNDLAYADALTSVHNKGAFDIYVRDLDAKLIATESKTEFAVCVFDCDNLKAINDKYGHEMGDQYLKSASALICSVFQHTPVFRTGGDEFTAILQGDDYQKRDSLIKLFRETGGALCEFTDSAKEIVGIAVGMAVYEPPLDQNVEDVARRADMLMYEDKRNRKTAREE